MSSVKTEIHVLNSDLSPEEYLHMSAAIIKRLKIPTHRTLSLKFGSRKLQVQVAPLPRNRKNVLRITESIADSLGLTDGDILRLTYDVKTKTIAIGPAIGVMLPSMTESLDRPFGNVTAFCKELHGASLNYGGLVYFFTPDGIAESDVDGLRYASSRFKRMRFPIPDIVYNRLTTRKLENKDSVQQFFLHVKSKHNGHVFNEKFLDKNDVFSALARDPTVRRLLPESHLFTKYEQLNSMCKRYGCVFLKPVTGSLGKGIIRISRDGGRIICQFASLSGSVRKTYSSLLKAFPTIKSKVQGKRYLIQQGLALITVLDRPVDFRALVQKNHKGEWSITSIVGRIANSQSFVSNVAQGGKLCAARLALMQSNLPSHLVANVYVTLKKAAIDIARVLDSEMPYHFAELGIDLAVDSTGRVWLLEGNSKPSKMDGTPLSSGKIRPSVKKMLLYSRALSGM